MINDVEPKKYTEHSMYTQSFAKRDVLKYSFIPNFYRDRNGQREFLIICDGLTLQLGICNDVTNGLGFIKIRESGETETETEEQLQNHLEIMDETSNFFDREKYGVVINGFWDMANEYKSALETIKEHVNKTYETAIEILPTERLMLNTYKTQLKEKDAEIESLKKKIKKNSLLTKIFG